MIRDEIPQDVGAIDDVLRGAFPTDLEARLVKLLREAGRLSMSLVAVVDGVVVGHVAFSPVTVDGREVGLGLAPVAVREDCRRRGVAAELIRTGLTMCHVNGVPLVVVLGSPAYYSRFGFVRADEFGMANEYGAGPEFMALGTPTPGLVRYAPEFSLFAP